MPATEGLYLTPALAYAQPIMSKPPTLIDNHLGRILRRRRRAMGLTQCQVAAAAGITFQQVQKYECGASRMSASRLFQLANVLELPVAEFFAGIEA